MRKLVLAGIAVVALGAVLIRAQGPVAGAGFEAASVKAVREGQVSLCRDDRGNQVPCANVIPHIVDGGRFRAVSPLHGPMGVIEWAYGVREFQVLGGPEWLARESFEIQGVTGPSSDTRMRDLVQRLLEERFGLKVHRERREIPVYGLVVAKGGPKLAAAKVAAYDIEVRPGRLVGMGATMGLFAHILSDNLERPVVDKTELAGLYDFSLTFEPSSTTGGFAPIGGAIFGPIQDLGLRLEPQKAPFEMVVIDAIGHPSEN